VVMYQLRARNFHLYIYEVREGGGFEISC